MGRVSPAESAGPFEDKKGTLILLVRFTPKLRERFQETTLLPLLRRSSGLSPPRLSCRLAARERNRNDRIPSSKRRGPASSRSGRFGRSAFRPSAPARE